MTPTPTPTADELPVRPRSTGRLLTYALFAGLLLAGLTLEKGYGEMHVSKMLGFASIGVWARELRGKPRWLLLAMVGGLELCLALTWYEHRYQHLVPLGPGVYRISNSPDPSK